jgi:hypothetical protein
VLSVTIIVALALSASRAQLASGMAALAAGALLFLLGRRPASAGVRV